MKTRFGFVSNSSTSSFYMSGWALHFDKFEDLFSHLKTLLSNEEIEKLYFGCGAKVGEEPEEPEDRYEFCENLLRLEGKALSLFDEKVCEFCDEGDGLPGSRFCLFFNSASPGNGMKFSKWKKEKKNNPPDDSIWTEISGTICC